MSLSNLAIVVIGRNEGVRLIRCLKSLPLGTGVSVYVDSGSTDGSSEAARALGVHVVQLDTSRAFTAARARNAGFAALKTLMPDVEFVQFVDGDCEVAAGWVDTAAEFLQARADVAVACGRRRERYPEVSVYNALCDDEWNTPIGQAPACGGDALIRAKAFEAVAGFRPSLIAGEEPELCVRLRQRGWKIWRLDAEMTLHDAAMTRFREWWRRNVRAGYGFAEVSRLHRDSPQGIWKRETTRAFLWGGIIPVLIILGALVHPTVLWAAAVYPLQIIRIARRRDWRAMRAWTYAVFVILAKFPEMQGALKFYAYLWQNKSATLIEYKAPNS